MVVRVINYSDFEDFCEDMGLDLSPNKLTDEQFMNIYRKEKSDWEFDNITDFCDEFNTDGPYAPMPSEHIIRFFPNE